MLDEKSPAAKTPAPDAVKGDPRKIEPNKPSDSKLNLGPAKFGDQ